MDENTPKPGAVSASNSPLERNLASAVVKFTSALLIPIHPTEESGEETDQETPGNSGNEIEEDNHENNMPIIKDEQADLPGQTKIMTTSKRLEIQIPQLFFYARFK